MQSNDLEFDLEFEISGEKLGELESDTIKYLTQKENEIAQAVHKVIMKKAWEIVSLEELKCQIIKNLHFIDLIKIKMDFSEKSPIRSKKHLCVCNSLTPFNTIEQLPDVLTNDLFAWIYYNEDDELKTFRFILNVSNGEIKYLNN